MIKSAFYSIVLRGEKVMKKRKFIEMNVILLLETWINNYLCFAKNSIVFIRGTPR